MTKQFWAVIAAIVIIFIGIFAIGGNKSKTNTASKSGATLTQHVEGSTASGVKLVEYGDYQCPYCEAYYPTVSAAVVKYKDQIQFQFRNYPLVNAHPNAFSAARAAEAAGLQNKFWEMHDSLYNAGNYSIWTVAKDPLDDFVTYAQNNGLNVAKFKTDFASGTVNDLINADMAEGNRLGIQGTPSFYIDDKPVSIANNASSFDTAIKNAITKKGKIKATAAPAATTDTTTPTTTEQTPTTSQ